MCVLNIHTQSVLSSQWQSCRGGGGFEFDPHRLAFDLRRHVSTLNTPAYMYFPTIKECYMTLMPNLTNLSGNYLILH
jgi:hypothetical protein